MDIEQMDELLPIVQWVLFKHVMRDEAEAQWSLVSQDNPCELLDRVMLYLDNLSLFVNDICAVCRTEVIHIPFPIVLDGDFAVFAADLVPLLRDFESLIAFLAYDKLCHCPWTFVGF